MIQSLLTSHSNNLVILLTQIDKKQFKTRIVQILGKCADIQNAEEYYQDLEMLSTDLRTEKPFLFLKDIFEVLGNTDRLLIINALQVKDRCSCELEALLKKSQPAISRDLRKLEEAKLIQGWKKGKFIHYSLVKPTFTKMREYFKQWLGSFENWFESIHQS